MGTSEYLVSSQKRCVVKVVVNGSGATFSLTGAAWGGTQYSYDGTHVDGADWYLPKDKDVALATVAYTLNGNSATLDFSSGTRAWVLPANSDGLIHFERFPIKNTLGGTGSTGQFTVTSTATAGVVIMEFIRGDY